MDQKIGTVRHEHHICRVCGIAGEYDRASRVIETVVGGPIHRLVINLEGSDPQAALVDDDAPCAVRPALGPAAKAKWVGRQPRGGERAAIERHAVGVVPRKGEIESADQLLDTLRSEHRQRGRAPVDP